MKFKLYKEPIYLYSPIQQILYNRGIPIEEQKQWLNAGWESINDWRLLDEQKMQEAIQIVKSVIENDLDIMVIVDSDVDGYTSSAIFINYLTDIDENYAKEHIHWIQHLGKEHGLADVVDDILENDKPISVVVCPDAASNDRSEHKRLKDAGISVVCLDHHDVEKDSEDALVINVQLCDYPNKSLTGAGVTWQFCRAFDEIEGYNFANDYLDIAALGDCGDMADYRQLEIRALINLGFENIANPFFFNMAKKNNYSIEKMNGINYYSVAFYVVPFVNAMVRSGTMEEKEEVFKSFLTLYAFEKIPSSKRGHKGEMVPRYEEAVTVAERVKRRQTKLQDETMTLLEKRIKEENLLDDAILLVLCQPGEVEKNLAG